MSATTFNTLPPVGLAAGLADAERARLWTFGDVISHDRGDALVKQGQPQGFLHVVLEGELRVHVTSEEALVTLGYVEPGESVGEMGLLEDVEAGATVVANSPSQTWAISRERFDAFVAAYPAVAVKFLREIAILLARRLRKGSERLLDSTEV